ARPGRAARGAGHGAPGPAIRRRVDVEAPLAVVDGPPLPRGAVTGKVEHLHGKALRDEVCRADEARRDPAVVGLGLVEGKTGYFDVVDREAAEVQVAIGHVFEPELDLLAGVWGKIRRKVLPPCRGLAARGPADAVPEV